MLLRIRSPAGTSRITVEPSTSGEDLAKLMLGTIPPSDPQPDPATLTLSNQPGSGGEQVPFEALTGRTVGDMGFSHGDLLFLSYKPAGTEDPSSHPTTTASSSLSQPAQPDPAHPHTHTDPPMPNTIPLTDLSKIEEPAVDVYWQARDGKIERKRDPAFCRHGEKGMCDYCMPLEPYDSRYQAEQQIKHLSYNAYLRKLLSSRQPTAASSSASAIPPLSPLSLSVMTPCPTGSHPPFPAGICSTCQPSAQTLTSQSYRMVDHVEFATPSIIEGLLGAWRRTGTQRFAFLIGRYDRYEKVPMGVKSVVEATWEPRQEGELDGLTVETPWEDEERITEIASWCEKGLGIVGMIYTDLTPHPDDITKSLHKRHAQSYTASSLEMLLSAAYQISHPLPTKASPTGHFSSRFASEHAEAMVKAGIVEASVDPGVVRVRRPGQGEYVPEVFYSFKNEYGIQVKMPAKPTFPVEYLFVNITHGFPVEPSPLFLSNGFPIENRPGLHDQSMEVVINQLASIVTSGEVGDTDTWPPRIKDAVGKWLSDWHLVCFLCMQGLFSLEEQKLLCRAATAHAHPSDKMAVEALFASGGFRTLLTIVGSSAGSRGSNFSGDFSSSWTTGAGASSSRSGSGSGSGNGRGATPSAQFDGLDLDSPSSTPARRQPVVPSAGLGVQGDESASAGAAAAAAGRERVCPHCTFVNEAGGSDCEICGLPLDG